MGVHAGFKRREKIEMRIISAVHTYNNSTWWFMIEIIDHSIIVIVLGDTLWPGVSTFSNSYNIIYVNLDLYIECMSV